LIFSKRFLKYFYSKNNLAKYNVHRSSCKSTRFYYQIFEATRIFSTDFRKYSNIKPHEDTSSESRVDRQRVRQMDREADRHDEGNIRFSQFC